METMDWSQPCDDDPELIAAALAADPDSEVGDDAVPLPGWAATVRPGALPTWYMPAPIRAPSCTGWRRLVLRVSSAALVVAFLTITAAGLCNTYGDLHL